MFKKPKQSIQAGLSVLGDHLTVAVVKHEKNKQPQLVDTLDLPINADSGLKEQLEKASKQLKLNKVPCICVMEPGSYSLLQVESPNVNTEELKSALRWKIKDLIDFHIDDATLDVFELPVSTRTGSTKMTNVVVARSALIKDQVEALHSAGIEPVAIDITELALRNIAHTDPELNAEPCTTMYALPDNIFIEVTDSQLLYLSRNIEAQFHQLSAPVDDEFSGWGDSSGFEMLNLEVQRSMDYYESHYGRGAASELRIYKHSDSDDGFIEYAREQLPFRISTVPLNNIVSDVESIDKTILPGYLPAVGAALRAI